MDKSKRIAGLSNEPKSEAPRSGLLNEFLWICAGVNRRLLRQCPTDYAKYAGIGGTILFTGLMAMLSGGYAFYKVFADVDPLSTELDNRALVLAIVFGIFWGLLIFNLDRFMVNTMYSDGTHKIVREEIKGGLPRIFLAFFLGIVISTPIEMRIFKDKIQTQLLIEQGKTGSKIDAEHQNLADEIAKLNAEKRSNDSVLNVQRNKIEDAGGLVYKEIYGTGITKRAGDGPAAKELRRNLEHSKRQLEALEEETKLKNNAIDLRLAPLLEEQSSYRKIRDEALKSDRGFTAELKALYALTSPSESFTLFMARILVMFLFITIEVIPTLFKMMMEFGPYDDILRAEKHKVKVLADKRISDINDEINTAVQISTTSNADRLSAEIKTNKELMQKVAKVQAELLQTAIYKWREEELKKIEADPSSYIKISESK